MPSFTELPEANQADIVARLQRIEGQARGIQKMIADGRDCIDILNQVAAVKAAVNSLSGEMVETFALYCVRHPEAFPAPEEAISQAVRALVRASR